MPYVKNDPIVGLMTTEQGAARDVRNGLGSTKGGTIKGVPATGPPQAGHSGGTTKQATNEPGMQC